MSLSMFSVLKNITTIGCVFWTTITEMGRHLVQECVVLLYPSYTQRFDKNIQACHVLFKETGEVYTLLTTGFTWENSILEEKCPIHT